jgi:hypothetical protein
LVGYIIILWGLCGMLLFLALVALLVMKLRFLLIL